MPEDANQKSTKLPIPQWEFVVMVATLMSLNALAIDTMLPALSNIADQFKLSNPNDQQLVVVVYIFGFGLPQLIFGPLSDRYGRKGLLRVCLIGYCLTGFACMMASTFATLLALRFVQGVFASGIRVIAVSVVRDVVAGRIMARIMSLVMTVFMIVPILAPAIGQIIMHYMSWEWTFGILGIGGFVALIWVEMRLPETLDIEKQKPLSLSSSLQSYTKVLKERMTLGYMAASGVIFGSLFAFITAAEQIFSDVFEQGDRFAILFACVAGSLAIANLTNARIVERLGMRRISHTVIIVFIVLAAANVAVMTVFGERLIPFLILFSMTFACFGMMGANFSAIAMEEQGDNAATASAAYGFTTTTIASLIGWMVASRFDGSVIPVLWGFVVLGIISLIIVWITERGELFEAARHRRK